MPPKAPVVVQLQHDLDDESIIQWFEQNHERYMLALDLDVGQASDPRINIDNIEITQVDLSADSIEIQYCIDSSAYFGCDDADYTDSENRDISGARQGNVFTFPHIGYPEEREPDDWDDGEE